MKEPDLEGALEELMAEMEEEAPSDPVTEDLLAPEEDMPETSKDSGGSETDSGDADEEPSEDDSDALQADFDKLKDQHLRLAAEYENYRKRVSAEMVSGWDRAQAELAGSLLEGLDDLQRVSRFTTEDATLETLIEGVDLVERKFLKALISAGLEAFDPSGEVFDPNRMEAMMRVETEEEGQDGAVHQVFQKGYTLKGQLLRPARVSVYTDDD